MGDLVLCGRRCVLRHTVTQHLLPLFPTSIASEPRRAPDFEMFLLGRQGKEQPLKFTVWVGNIYVNCQSSKWGYLNNRTQSSRNKIIYKSSLKSLFLASFCSCGILMPWPRMKPVPPAGEVQSPNCWAHQGSP